MTTTPGATVVPLTPELVTARLVADVEGGWDRRRLDPDEAARLDTERTSIALLAHGSHGVVDLASRRRWVQPGVWPVPPTEAARAYLATTMALYAADAPAGTMLARGRVPRRAAAHQLLDIPPALYFAGPSTSDEDLALVDITACYWSLLSAAPLDVEVRLDPTLPRLGLGRIWLPARDRLAASKPVRNTLYGQLRARRVRIERHGQPGTVPIASPTHAPDAVGLVLAQVHAIAHDAVELFGCRAWLTDAAIVPVDEAPHLLTWLADRWGLDARVEATGPGQLRAPNAYRIGDKTTAGYHTTRPAPPLNGLLDLDHRTRAWLTAQRHRLIGLTPDTIDWPDTSTTAEHLARRLDPHADTAA